jgi:hypothetical protein
MPQDYLTQADVQNYGPELVDFAQRAATHVVAPELARRRRSCWWSFGIRRSG